MRNIPDWRDWLMARDAPVDILIEQLTVCLLLYTHCEVWPMKEATTTRDAAGTLVSSRSPNGKMLNAQEICCCSVEEARGSSSFKTFKR